MEKYKNFFKFCTLTFIISFFLTSFVFAQSKIKNSDEHLTIIGGNPNQSGSTPFPKDEGTRKILQRTELEEEARQLAKNGLYDQAITKFKDAIKPELINRDYEKATAMGGILEILKWQGKYEEALQYLQWFIDTNTNETYKPRPVDFEDESEIGGMYSAKQSIPVEKHELDALVKFKDTGSTQPIYEHINYLKKRHKQFLPPKGYEPVTTSLIVSDIIRLYDLIGDSDSALTFIREILKYRKLTPHARVEYGKIKRAFEEDKKQSTKGRATQALIQSDYFPW